MRLDFGTRIFLALLCTTSALLAGWWVAVDRAYTAQMTAQIPDRVRQGEKNFEHVTILLQGRLARSALILASSPPLIEELSNPLAFEQVGPLAARELARAGLEEDFLALYDPAGYPAARYVSQLKDGKKVLEPLRSTTAGKGPVAPEQSLVAAALSSAQPPALHADLERYAPLKLRFTYVAESGRIFHVGAVPLRSAGQLRGVAVIGLEVGAALTRRIHELQDSTDAAAYMIGMQVVCSNLGASQCSSARSVFPSDLGALTCGQTRYMGVTLEGHPYLAAVRRLNETSAEEPLFTALYVSVQSFVTFQTRMRRATAIAGAIALLACLVIAARFAYVVSAPVRDLVVGTTRVAQGDYSCTLAVRSSDELGDLAVAFNKMAHDLRTKEKVRAVLAKVVSPDVAEELLRGDLGLGGRTVEATLLFADLRGFTAMSRTMAPEQVVGMLNEYLSLMSREILKARGIVDKYVGDEIIGVFGAPKSHDKDALSAVRAAWAMLGRLRELNVIRAERGETPLRLGIGVNSGPVVAGCMGSPDLMSYTCIGEPMNMASRLCSSAAAGQLLISASTRNAVGDAITVRALEPIIIKGYVAPVDVFEVIAVRDEPEPPTPPQV